MYHLRLKGDHYQMGVKQGKIFQKCQISFPLHLDKFQLEHGKQSEKMLKDFFPEVCAEIKGVSDTIGADYDTFASLTGGGGAATQIANKLINSKFNTPQGEAGKPMGSEIK